MNISSLSEYGSLKSTALIFHDRDLTSDGEKRFIVTRFCKLGKSRDNHISWENSSLKLENLLKNNQDLMFQSRNAEASKSSSGSWPLFDTYDRQVQWWKERQDTKYKNCLLQNMKTDGSMKFYYWRRFRTSWYRDKIKGTVRPEKLNLMKRYKQHLQSSYRGDFLMS